MIEPEQLAPLVDDGGHLHVLALDHRDSLRVEFDAEDPDSVSAEDLTGFKLDVATAFGPRPSAVMLDPEFSIEPILQAGRLPVGVGSLCALEAQGYLAKPDARVNRLLEGWTPARAKLIGASAAKLLVLYRPDRGEATAAQEDLVRSTVAACGEVGIPLFVEPVPYELVDADDRERVVVESAERIGALEPDVVKMPFPSVADEPKRWEAACRRVDDATARPWAVLSWGAPFETFRHQVETACGNGCSGFMAGRAIWREAIPPEGRAAAIAGVAIPRFDELVRACSEARSVFASR